MPFPRSIPLRILFALAACAVAAVAMPRRAAALQPVEVFAKASRAQSPDALEARAALSLRQAEATLALGRQLPGISLQGAYARNQYESPVKPQDQVGATAILNVPLVDLAAFQRIAAARTGAQAAAHQLEATRLQIEAETVQDYYQLVASQALVAASKQQLQVARQNLQITIDRYRAGSAAVLDVERGRADVELQVQQLAAAELNVELAARALQSVSGVEPDLSEPLVLADDLHEERPLDEFSRSLKGLPSVKAASARRYAAEQQVRAEQLDFVPALSGNLSERYANQPLPGTHRWNAQAALTLGWSFDLTTLAGIDAQKASVDAARAGELRTRLAAGDTIHRYWNTVVAGLARSRSARAQHAAAAHAADLARDRYRAGAATQLDLLQAQRDAFSAEVTRIQADADLVNARTLLRLAAGRSLVAGMNGEDP